MVGPFYTKANGKLELASFCRNCAFYGEETEKYPECCGLLNCVVLEALDWIDKDEGVTENE